MTLTPSILALILAGTALVAAQNLKLTSVSHAQESAELEKQIAKNAEELAYVQDELVADVMELVEDQTVPGVIELLEEVETVMVEVTDGLMEAKTGGSIIAAETEVIEKIFEAAKKKQQSGDAGSQESMGAMLDMMQRMMGVEPGGEKPGEEAGQGSTGDSDAKNSAKGSHSEGKSEERTISKGSAPTGQALPLEFRKLVDAYNQNRK